MTLMLTLGTATFGAQKTLPSGKDTGSINVTNLKPGDTVTAYQFVKADYNEYGFTGYSAINNYVKDPVAPTAQEVIGIKCSHYDSCSREESCHRGHGSYT